MKHIDEIYKEWSWVKHTVNSGHLVHDSAETCDFAEFYSKNESLEFAKWLLNNAVVVQPNFVGYWRFKKDNRLYTTNRMYQLFKSEPTQIAQKNEFVIPAVSVSVCPHCQSDSSKIVESEKRKCFGCGRLFYGHTER